MDQNPTLSLSVGFWSIHTESGLFLQGKSNVKGGAFSYLAVHRDRSPMVFDDLRDNVQPHAQAGDRSLAQIWCPIEPFKNLVALLSRDAQPMIADADRDRLWGCTEVNLDHLCFRSI